MGNIGIRGINLKDIRTLPMYLQLPDVVNGMYSTGIVGFGPLMMLFAISKACDVKGMSGKTLIE
jgi:hypothetical protein